MRPRTRWLAGSAALVVAVAGIVVGLLLAGRGSPGHRSPNALPSYQDDPARGRAFAGKACRDLDAVIAAVDRNDTAPHVLALLGAFQHDALVAYSHDVRWVRLTSAAQELDTALRNDDPTMTRQGLGTARAECARAR